MKRFMSLGLKEGNTGMVLLRRKGLFITYRGFGTIENPRKTLLTMSLVHCEKFSGPMATPEEVINPKPSILQSAKIVMLDFGKGKNG